MFLKKVEPYFDIENGKFICYYAYIYNDEVISGVYGPFDTLEEADKCLNSDYVRSKHEN